MTRHQIARHTAKRRPCCREHAAFGAAHIGDDGLGRQVIPQRFELALHRPEGHRHHHHIGALHPADDIGFVAVDDPKSAGRLKALAMTPHAHSLTAEASLAQRPRQRAANQPHTDDTKTIDHGELLLRVGRLLGARAWGGAPLTKGDSTATLTALCAPQHALQGLEKTVVFGLSTNRYPQEARHAIVIHRSRDDTLLQ